jgi:nitrite reductase/ring-hydroxylating ferredoxin subunit
MSASKPRWQLAFPYRWDEDDAVTRRELLRFAVYTSGALFAAAAGIAVLGTLRGPAGSAGPRVAIARLSEIPEGEARYFRYPGPDDEAVLIRLRGGELVAYGQRCPHLSCAVVYQPDRRRVVCPCHEGVFDPRTGVPTAGPPRRPLTPIRLAVEGGVVYAAGVGP